MEVKNTDKRPPQGVQLLPAAFLLQEARSTRTPAMHSSQHPPSPKWLRGWNRNVANRNFRIPTPKHQTTTTQNSRPTPHEEPATQARRIRDPRLTAFMKLSPAFRILFSSHR